MFKRIGWTVGVMALVVGLIAPAWGGEQEDSGRAVFDKYQKAVVTIQLVLRVKFSSPEMGSDEKEAKDEVVGMIIDPSGLAVASLNRTDPSMMYENMMMGSDANIEVNVQSAKYLLDDGKEIEARVVLRDKDLDLAFLKPVTAPETPMTAVDLSQAAMPKILDPIVGLVRLGKVAGRVCSATMDRVQAVIEKPRTLYVPCGPVGMTDMGSPVFSLDGKAIGMMALRSIKSESNGDSFGPGDDNAMPVIVPAADIAEAAAQATAEE